MNQIFSKAQLYSKRFDHKKRIEKELKLLQTTLAALPTSSDNHIIDLACGPGMHGNWFAEHGFNVTGIDIEKEAIQIAKSLYPAVSFNVGDMRDIQADKANLVLFLGNTISSSKSPEDLELIISSIANVLHDGGILLIHHLNYDPSLWNEPKVIVTQNNPDGKNIIAVKTMVNFQDRILVNFVYYYPDDNWTNIGQHAGALRKILPDELDPILDKHGFIGLATFGSGACEPFDPMKSNDCFRLLQKNR